MRVPPVIPAATVVLLRDPPAGHTTGFEVFLVKRPARASFMPHAHVFPGGRVDTHDREPAWRDRVDGLEAFVHRAREGAEDELAHGVAAIRELFEEAGVLLACDATGHLVSHATALSAARTAVHDGTAAFLDVCRSHGWRLALDRLRPWSRWVTPAFEPKRFDARFYVACWSGEGDASHDGRETVASDWMTPAEAIARSERGEHLLGLPTLRTLFELARFDSPAAAAAATAGRPLDPIDPLIYERDDERWLVLPGDPDYPRPVSFAVEPPTRYRLDAARWKPA